MNRPDTSIPVTAINPGLRQAIATPRPDVMIVSHERSGTHFLINSLVAAYGYSLSRFVHFDQMTLPINYFAARSVADVLSKIAARRSSTLIKSHHTAEFFEGVLDEVLKHTAIFYIHRDPVEVMISAWRFMHIWKWHEGPRLARALDFAAAEPEGQMLRYQMKQRRNMLDRWARHVDGWTAAAEGRDCLVVVRFDQLKNNYEQTVSAFANVLGPHSGTLAAPSRHENVIIGPPADRFERPDVGALRALALAEVGDTMKRQGYA